jgi:PmbA protein
MARARRGSTMSPSGPRMAGEPVQQSLLTKERCRELFGQVQQAARTRGVADVEALFAAHRDALTRFANNIIHQNVAEQAQWLSVRVALDQKTARATTNRFDAASIQSAVEQAIALARSVAADPEMLPMAEAQPVAEIARYDAATAAASPSDRAQAVAEAIRLVESAGQTAAGIYSNGETIEAILNSRGLAGWHQETLAQFSITAMADDSSGWAKASAVSHSAFDPVALAGQASGKARLSKDPREVAPGRYTVILEPAAVLDLVGQIFGDFSATSVHDKRSFLTDRMGTRLFGENIHISDDVAHPLQAGVPFDGEGIPRGKLALVEAGVPRELAYSRASAKRMGVAPTGHGFPLPNDVGEAPLNIVIAGGDTPVEQMIASTERGILVTRLWYIREVDPFEKIMTGMTRDGTFLIEDGAVRRGLRNFRFNQGIIEMLNNVEAMSPVARASGEEAFDMVVPAMKVRNFNFTEVTRF